MSKVIIIRGTDRDTNRYLIMANFKTQLSRVWIRDTTNAKTGLDAKKLEDLEVIKIY